MKRYITCALRVVDRKEYDIDGYHITIRKEQGKVRRRGNWVQATYTTGVVDGIDAEYFIQRDGVDRYVTFSLNSGSDAKAEKACEAVVEAFKDFTGDNDLY